MNEYPIRKFNPGKFILLNWRSDSHFKFEEAEVLKVENRLRSPCPVAPSV